MPQSQQTLTDSSQNLNDGQPEYQRDFQGINLQGAEELYREFNKMITDLQAADKQQKFILNQMKSKDFEISSLSPVLRDPVSAAMIAKASELTLEAKDTNNRSVKELERIAEESALQRRFLEMHVKQMNILGQLQEDLLQEKLATLQKVTLELIDQQVSILENQMMDYLKTRQGNLEQERELIEMRMLDSRKNLAQLPKKWLSEQILKHRLDLNKRLMDEVTRLVETKTISQNLEFVQSAPLDLAYPPHLPKSPRLLLYLIIGGILGALISFGVFLAKTIHRGVYATRQNLELQNQKVAGQLTWRCQAEHQDLLFDSDLETLRHLMTHLCDSSPKNSGMPLLLIQGDGPDYSSSLASLLTKKQFKVLILDISFDNSSSARHSNGLLHYLEGKGGVAPAIQKGKHYDFLPSGGVSRYASELLDTSLFRQLLQDLLKSYDYVIVSSHAKPLSAEAVSLLKIFDKVAISIEDESLLDLQPYLANSKQKTMTFVLATT